MSGRLDKIVAMFNALDDSDKEYVLTEFDYPDLPEAEQDYIETKDVVALLADHSFPPPPADPPNHEPALAVQTTTETL